MGGPIRVVKVTRRTGQTLCKAQHLMLHMTESYMDTWGPLSGSLISLGLGFPPENRRQDSQSASFLGLFLERNKLRNLSLLATGSDGAHSGLKLTI